MYMYMLYSLSGNDMLLFIIVGFSDAFNTSVVWFNSIIRKYDFLGISIDQFCYILNII